MRGKDAGNDGLRENDGITPAYAGKSASIIFASSQCKDHPRVCGEKE